MYRQLGQIGGEIKMIYLWVVLVSFTSREYRKYQGNRKDKKAARQYKVAC
jgi:hypothetical protein